ncbi:MAG: class I SAM-dependent methyltransferase, partial [Chloroflexi bacterium]|nr:class I SAM-dependent methyltransferase [Chloroflexota bacterium]
GCGTGYTACLLAREYDARVVAIDLRPKVLEWARRRIREAGASTRVATLVADAHALPFAPNSFDAAIAESVLVFCEPTRVAAEVRRVLKPGGVFGDNELTSVRESDWLSEVFSAPVFGISIQVRPEAQWQAALEAAGFSDVSSTLHRFSPWQQLLSHLQVDGPRKYFASIVAAFTDPAVKAMFWRKDLLGYTIKAFQSLPYIRYGLYVGRKIRE